MTPHFFYISDIANSSSFNGKIFRKKSMLEKFRANVLKQVFREICALNGFMLGVVPGVAVILKVGVHVKAV